MLHITKFYKPACLGCSLLDTELELLQLDPHFTVPFVLHSVNVLESPDLVVENLRDQRTNRPVLTRKYKIKKVPLLIFEIISDDISPDSLSPIPKEGTIVGALDGFHRKASIVAYITEILALHDMDTNSLAEKLSALQTAEER